jgi:hypothetical protein
MGQNCGKSSPRGVQRRWIYQRKHQRMSIVETEEFKRGRSGEIIQHSFCVEHGFTTFYQAGSVNSGAPMLQSPTGNIIAPDELMIRNVAVFMEHKTKTKIWDWGGGSPLCRTENMPNYFCYAHGIDLRSLHEYKRANDKLPVILSFLAIRSGDLHMASLDELGEGWEGDINGTPVMNWELSRMHRVVNFNSTRLKAYFSANRKRDRLPTDSERRALISWLEPREPQFNGFLDYFIDWQEKTWKARHRPGPRLVSSLDNFISVGDAANRVVQNLAARMPKSSV